MLENLTKIVDNSNAKIYNRITSKERGKTAMNVNERIKELRNELHLSQDYVAKYLGISRSTYTQMENGKRKVLADEVTKLSNLYGVSTDSLLNNKELSQPATVFARSFEKLDQRDQEEIMNLIRFKEHIKAQKEVI